MMKHVLGAALALLALLGGVASAATMEPDLANRLAAADANQKFAVDFFMKAQANALSLDGSIENLPKPLRRARVATVLQEYSAATQRDLLDYLKSQENVGKVDDIRSLWICNLVGCWATKDVIYDIAARNDVDLVVYGKVPVELGKLNLNVPPPPHDGIEPNMVTTNVRGAWKQGYHGENVVLGVVDTGVWYTHDDLTNHLWESTVYPNHGFNYASSQFSSGHPGPSSYDTLTPLDYYGHGTHCAGIATADGAYGNGTNDTMGIAPATKLMCLPVDVYLHSPYPDTSMENNTMLGYQFCVSPPRDPTNGADAITTSLGLVAGWLPRKAIFRACEENVNAAGIPHMIAAGNEGPSPRSIRTSGDCPPPWPNPANNPVSHAMSAVITVGATDNNDNAASFTSIGPSDWGSVSPYNDYAYPPGLLDPDVMMPGVDILSTYYGGNRAYTTMSGTSMATPGAAGAVCLMLSKNPNLTPRQIDSILEMHAVTDLGPSGKENTFGAGRINCSLAVAFTPLPSGLRLHRRIVDDVAGGNGDGIVNPGETVNFPTWIINLDAMVHDGVTGEITKRNPADPLFSITDSVKTFGTVQPNDSAYTGASGYKIAVSGAAVNGDVLGMDLTLRDDNDSIWVNGYDVAVGTAVLTAAGIVIRDSVGGNGNGLLDPGEQADVIVLLHNGGLGNGYAINGVLSSSNPSWLTINDPDGAYGTILRDSTVGNFGDRYVASASAGAQPGTAIPCTLQVSGTGYSGVLVFSITVGRPPTPPGQIIWGPRTIPNPPGGYSIYGMAYNSHNDRLYVAHFNLRRIDIMSSDSLLTNLGSIPTPNAESGCTDIKYCAYDNTFWVHTNVTKRIYKIDTAGNVLRYISSPAVDYPCGLGWDEVTRTLYLTDRRSVNVNPNYLYTIDTLGNTVHARIDYPFVSYAGARCLAIDRMDSNPFLPTLINLYTWFNTGGGLDSIGVYELKHDTFEVLSHFMIANAAWNCRGVEIDPRDGNLWISIMQNNSPPPSDNSIFKCGGFHFPTGVEEKPFLVATGDAMWCRAVPNPFPQKTRFNYLLARGGDARLVIYDASGRVVRTLVNGRLPAGEHSVTWNGHDEKGQLCAQGVYFFDLITGSGKLTGKALLLR